MRRTVYLDEKNKGQNSKQEHKITDIVELTDTNRKIENLYNVLVSGLFRMKEIDKKDIFSYVIFGGGNQDDLTTIKTIDLKELPSDQKNIFKNYVRNIADKYKGTDYAFRPISEGTKIQIPYICIVDIVNSVIDKQNKSDQTAILTCLQNNIVAENNRKQKKANLISWSVFGIGTVSSVLSLVGLIVPNVSTLTPALSQGLKIVGYVGLGITLLFVSYATFNRIMKGLKKNTLRNQINTIDNMINNVDKKKTILTQKHNAEIRNHNNNLAKANIEKTIQNLQNQYLDKPELNNNNIIMNIPNNNQELLINVDEQQQENIENNIIKNATNNLKKDDNSEYTPTSDQSTLQTKEQDNNNSLITGEINSEVQSVDGQSNNRYVQENQTLQAGNINIIQKNTILNNETVNNDITQDDNTEITEQVASKKNDKAKATTFINMDDINNAISNKLLDNQKKNTLNDKQKNMLNNKQKNNEERLKKVTEHNKHCKELLDKHKNKKAKLNNEKKTNNAEQQENTTSKGYGNILQTLYANMLFNTTKPEEQAQDDNNLTNNENKMEMRTNSPANKPMNINLSNKQIIKTTKYEKEKNNAETVIDKP